MNEALLRTQLLNIINQLDQLAATLSSDTVATTIHTITAQHPPEIPARIFYRQIQAAHPNISQATMGSLLRSLGYTRIKRPAGIVWVKPQTTSTTPSTPSPEPPPTTAAAAATVLP